MKKVGGPGPTTVESGPDNAKNIRTGGGRTRGVTSVSLERVRVSSRTNVRKLTKRKIVFLVLEVTPDVPD